MIESSSFIRVESDSDESIVVSPSPNTILWFTSKKALSETDLDSSEAWYVPNVLPLFCLKSFDDCNIVWYFTE